MGLALGSARSLLGRAIMFVLCRGVRRSCRLRLRSLGGSLGIAYSIKLSGLISRRAIIKTSSHP